MKMRTLSLNIFNSDRVVLKKNENKYLIVSYNLCLKIQENHLFHHL